MVKKVEGDDWVIMSSITPPDRSPPINIQKDIEGLETEASRQFYLHNYTESINLYNKILELLEQTQPNINHPIHKGVPLHMIGVCYTSINEHDKALRYIMLAYIEDTLNVPFKFEDLADTAPAACMLRDYNINPKILQAVKELSRKAKSDGKWSKLLDPNTILQELEEKEKINSNKLTEQLKSVPTQSKFETRLQKIEQNLSEYRDKIDKLKEKLELKIPENMLKSLPEEIRKNIELIRKLYFQGTPEACPPFIRKTLSVAIVIRFKRDKKEGKIYNEDNQPYDLPKLIEISKQEKYISNYLCTQLSRIKIFGDIGIHDYRIDLKEEDIIPLFELLRLALESLYKENHN